MFIVLGRIGQVADDIHVATVLKDKIPVLRRSSGGGTVLQGKGCLNFSLILSKYDNPQLNDIRKSYQIILNKVMFAVKQLGVEAIFQHASDLALIDPPKKFSGNAQRRCKKFILHHGTLLYDFPLFYIEKYLKMPKEVPVYRHGRSHEAFVTNLAVNPDDCKAALRQVFNARQQDDDLSFDERKCLDKFLKEKEITLDL